MTTRVRGAHEVVERPRSGRVFEADRRVRYGDCGPDGLLRSDALARYLQDVAGDDSSDLGAGHSHAWVVRRVLVEVDRPARAWEQLNLATWCGGVGSHWAERVVTLKGTGGASIRTATVWVMVDMGSQRPARITHQFLDAYGEASGGRKVSCQLHLPIDPPAGSVGRPWPLRRADIDVMGHMNNAIAWSFVEEAVDLSGFVPCRPGRAELEFREPVLPDDHLELVWSIDASAGLMAWGLGCPEEGGPPTTRFVARLS